MIDERSKDFVLLNIKNLYVQNNEEQLKGATVNNSSHIYK